MALPNDINEYLSSVYEEKGRPFCFSVDAQYRLKEAWCASNSPPLMIPDVGESMLDCAPFLLGSLTHKLEVLPFVSTRNGSVFEVHTFPQDDHHLVILLSTDQEHAFRQNSQQTANEVLLLHRAQEKLIVRQRELISDLIEAKSELDHRRREAERINASKNEFIAMMSHEFRTPLSAVINYADRAQESGISSIDVKKCNDAIARASRHLASLVDTVLDDAKLDATRGKMTLAPIDVNSLINDMAAILAPLAAEKGLSFAAYLDNDVPPTLLSDVVFLRQILINLLGNAIKYTDTGAVKLNISWADDNLNIKVVDTGPGIAPEDQERIFQAFERGNNTHSTTPGAGLGLAISLDLAKTLQGHIHIESSVGGGCEISLSIPAPAIGGEEHTNDILPRPTADLYASQPATILVCDDDEDMLALCDHYLDRAGYNMILAEDGLRGVEKALEYHPDLILMDINTPKLNGLDAANTLRDAGFSKPIIAVTAYDINKINHTCFTTSLRKPFQMPVLMELIKETLTPQKQP